MPKNDSRAAKFAVDATTKDAYNDDSVIKDGMRFLRRGRRSRQDEAGVE